MKLSDIRVGSTVMVRGDFGTGKPVKAKVEAVLKNIKNGHPGIDYVIKSTGDERWAYLDQIDSVVKF